MEATTEAMATVTPQELASLRSLRPTSDLELALVQLEARQASGKPALVRWDRMFAQARDQIQRGRLRDMIQASRPEGCTCLGTGEMVKESTEGVVYIAGSCSCPEGVARADRLERQLRESIERDGLYFLDHAGIPPLFEGFTFDTYPGRVPEEVRRWKVGDKGLFLHGEYGTGKTGLAVALLKRHILAKGNPGLFVTVPAVLDEIRATYDRTSEATESKLTNRVLKVPLLVMDDLGAERPTEWVVEKLFTLINHRHDHLLPTIFTSNLSIPQLSERLGERTTWRIVEMSEVVHLQGPNLRAKK